MKFIISFLKTIVETFKRAAGKNPYILLVLPSTMFSVGFVIHVLAALLGCQPPNETIALLAAIVIITTLAAIVLLYWMKIRREQLLTLHVASKPSANDKGSGRFGINYENRDLTGETVLKVASEYVEKRGFKYLGRLLEVLEEENVIKRKELEKRLLQKGVILDVLAQDRGLWSGMEEAKKEQIIREIARLYNVHINIGNLFGVYMYSEARRILAKYTPTIYRLTQQRRLTAVTEFLIVLRNVKDNEELRRIITDLAKGYKDFLVESISRYINLHKSSAANIGTIQALQNTLHMLKGLDHQRMLLPPLTRDERHPSITVTIPFDYTIEAIYWLKEALGAESIGEILLRELFETEIRIGGIKIHHLLKAVGCRHGETLEEVKKIEDEAVNRMGYSSLLDLIKSRGDAASAIVDALKDASGKTLELLEKHCNRGLKELEKLTAEIQEVIK